MKNNIKNLFQIWEKLTGNDITQVANEKYQLSLTEIGAWPNRLCLHPNVTVSDIPKLKKALLSYKQKIVIPLAPAQQDLLTEFQAAGFEILFEQTIMDLDLKPTQIAENHIHCEKVTSFEMAKQWARLFQEAFSYEIAPSIIYENCSMLSFYIAYHKHHSDTAIGTVLIYDAYETRGIHAMGIIPSKRRMGLADELMNYVLQLPKNEDIKQWSLQASSMGEGLYTKLGFTGKDKLINITLK